MATQAQNVPPTSAFIRTPGFPKIRAVVADDTRDMQKITSWILEREGQVEVVGTADNGLLAVSVTEVLNPDLVVLDVNMPKMSGFEAAMLIKERSPETKVLIISSDDNPDLGLCALDCGADGFLWKGNLNKQCNKQVARMFGN